MAEAKEVEKKDKKVAKKTKKVAKKKTYTITKSNGKVIHRDRVGDLMLKNYEDKGWKVEEV